MNLELRAPLLGLLAGDIYYGRVPIEAIAFVDAGFLWTRNAGSRRSSAIGSAASAPAPAPTSAASCSR